MNREDEIRKRLEAIDVSDSFATLGAAASDVLENAPADLRYLLEKVNEYRVACEHWQVLWDLMSDKEQAALKERLVTAAALGAVPLNEAIRRLKEPTA